MLKNISEKTFKTTFVILQYVFIEYMYYISVKL